MSSYYKVDENRINVLREFADKLKDVQELNALCMLYALRSMQEVDEDMIKDGEIGPEHLLDKHGCEARAWSFLEDTVCEIEMAEVAKANDLGDYSIQVVPVVTIVKSI